MSISFIIIAAAALVLAVCLFRRFRPANPAGSRTRPGTKWLLPALAGIWLLVSFYFMLDAGLSHSEAEKSIYPWKILLAFALIVLLPSLVWYVRQVSPASAAVHRRWRHRILAGMLLLLILISACRSGLWPPLAWAMRNHWPWLTLRLIDFHITLETADAYGQTPLEIAACSNDLTTLKLLLTHGSRLRDRPAGGARALWQACLRGHDEAAGLLLAQGIEPDTVFHFGAYEGWTPLMTAARHGQLKVVRILIARGANPAITNPAGGTAAQIAQINGQHDIYTFLTAVPATRTK